MDIQKTADEIKAQIIANRSGETPKDTAARWKKATEKRDQAMKKVFTYQDKVGLPKEKEENDDFAIDTGLGTSFADVEKHAEE